MSTDDKLMEQVQTLLIERSKKAIALAREAVITEQIKYTPLKEALCYFMEKLWFNAAHPALMSLTCESVGGDPEATTEISAAFVLLTGAADIHDDIIDQSITKDSKPTVYGKYGKDIAIITGDVLWFKGMLMLNEACKTFPEIKKQSILELAKQSFFDIGSVEAKEASLRRNLDIAPEEYLNIIVMKVSIARAAAEIGAMVGDATVEEVENLGQLGEMIALLMTIRDEYCDMFEVDELSNRFHNECLPLPILYAFKDAALKNQILGILAKQQLMEGDVEKIVELVVSSQQICELTVVMHSSMEKANQSLIMIKKNKIIFSQLLNSSLLDLPE